MLKSALTSVRNKNPQNKGFPHTSPPLKTGLTFAPNMPWSCLVYFGLACAKCRAGWLGHSLPEPRLGRP